VPPSSRICSLLAFLLAGAPAIARAQSDPPLDPKVSLPILLKVLTYDASFAQRVNKQFVVLIPSSAPLGSARDELLARVKGLGLDAIQNRPLVFLGADFTDAISLKARVADSGAGALLALPDSGPAEVAAIAEVAQASHIYALALDARMVESGLQLAVASKNGKPQVVINTQAAVGIGARFDPSILKLARLIRPSAGGSAAPELTEARVEFGTGMTAPKFVSGPDPEYTAQAIDHEVSGEVVAKCLITAEGSVHDCRVLKGQPFMDRAVVDALERRKYSPALREGKPIPVDYTFKISLKLPQ
jgi:TonB family protein